MSRNNYEMLMSELDAIAEKLHLFSPDVQAEVFRSLVAALLDESVASADDEAVVTGSNRTSRVSGEVASLAPATNENVDVWNEAEQLSILAEEFGLRNLNGIEWAAVAVFFFTVLAPGHARVESVSVEQFEEACLTIGHPVGNAEAALANAKRRHKRYLKGGKREGYSLTGHGKNFVRGTLLKGDG